MVQVLGGCLENSTFPRVDRIALFKLKASSRVADPILARLDGPFTAIYGYSRALSSQVNLEKQLN